MCSLVFAHVDQLGRLLNPAKGAFHRGLRSADKGHDGTVSSCAGIDIEQRHSFCGFNRICDLPNNVRVSAFGEIGHALDQLLHDQSRTVGFTGSSMPLSAAKLIARE